MSDPDLYQAHHYSKWSEDDGNVLWWRLPVSEPPYVGTPLDLGRSVTVTLTIGVEESQHDLGMTGGWPFDEEDEGQLVWTCLPGAIRWP